MKFTKNNATTTPAFLALGYCPCQRSGGYYDTVVIPVYLQADKLDLLTKEWFDVCKEFEAASEWYQQQDSFYFPHGKNESRQWSETQWQLCSSFEEAEKKALMWENNDLSEEMPEMEFMYSWQSKELVNHISSMKEAGRWN